MNIEKFILKLGEKLTHEHEFKHLKYIEIMKCVDKDCNKEIQIIKKENEVKDKP